MIAKQHLSQSMRTLSYIARWTISSFQRAFRRAISPDRAAVSWRLAGLAFSTCIVACSATDRGGHSQIELSDFRSERTIGLVNASHPDYQDLYSQVRDSANLKVLDDDEMASLLDDIDDAGFSQYAEATSQAPADPKSTFEDMITLTVGDRRRFVAIPRAAQQNPEERQAIVTIKLLVHSAYSTAVALQSVKNQSGHRLFRREKDRLLEQDRESRERQQ